jgi:TonB family protein
MEAVTAVLLDRQSAGHRLRPMVVCSLAAHALAAAAIAFGPARLLPSTAPGAPRVVMSVSLGGSSGPVNGGANPLGGRPVQRVAKPADKPQPLRPPAAKAPLMTVPAPVPAPKTPAKAPRTPPLDQPAFGADEATGRTPTTGPEEKSGSSFADTGVSGLGLGLATGGAGAGGALDVGSFCCPDYLGTMARRIKENWNYRQGMVATTVMRFTIRRNGQITDIAVEQSAGYVLDLAAQRALQMLRQLPPLPAAYPNSTLTVYLRFDYQR